MAMSKIERIEKEIQKTREKITEYQNRLRGLEAQKTEAENLEIVQLVRAMRLTPQELTAMLSGNGIPGIAPMPKVVSSWCYSLFYLKASTSSGVKGIFLPNRRAPVSVIR